MVSDAEAKAIIAENLTRILEEQGRTKYWLSKQISDHEGKIGRVAKGETMPSAGFLIRVSEALGVSLDDLMQERITA